MPSPITSSLETHLGYWLRYVSNHVSHAFARKLEAEGVTAAEWVLIRALFDEESIAPSRLADRLDLTRGAISKLADRLLDKALIARHDNLADARGHALALTPAGRALAPRLAALADRNDAEFFDHLSPDERETLGRVLRDIVKRRGLKPVPVS